MKLATFFLALTLFVSGITVGMFLDQPNDWTNQPDGNYDRGVQEQIAYWNPFNSDLPDRASPQDRISEQQIAVWQDRIELDIQDAEWATFTDTKSMEPVIMKGSNAIEIRPAKIADVEVGDICSYKSEYAEGSIIHRVVYKGQDEEGTYFVFKGDNVPTSDPGRVRFNQVERCVVAIIY